MKHINLYKKFIFAAIIMIVSCAAAVAMQNTGKERILIDGGAKGNIDFPHRIHQDAVSDCTVCHSVFPQKEGSIKELKVQQKLEKKQVMNGTCLNCHRAMKKEGRQTGPTSCNQCHTL